MKGIILAGGTGTRLYPLTMAVSKQLMPVYDKPMIYYPLSMLMLAEIRDILIITTPQDESLFTLLLGNGSDIGCTISYAVQEKPSGIAEAFIIGEKFIGDDAVALILGDNIFYGRDLPQLLLSKKNPKGACIFAYPVAEPQRYGVINFDNNKKPISIEEKPKNPSSQFAIPGMYFYDNSVVNKVQNIQPSARGELEITDINNLYLNEGTLDVAILSRGTAWLDTGTIEDLQNASEFIRIIEQRQGFKISCIEEIAYRKQWINQKQLLSTASKYSNSAYGKYLEKIAYNQFVN